MSTNGWLSELSDENQSVLLLATQTGGFENLIADIRSRFNVRRENLIVFDPGEGEGVKGLREMIYRFAAKPFGGHKKLLVIPSAELLNQEQANTLLKVLEEPPSHGRIFLLSKSLGKILPTIKSRCQKYFVELKEGEAVASHVVYFKKGDFIEYCRVLKDLEREEIPAILKQTLKELKGETIADNYCRLYREAGEALLLMETTNCGRKLALEKLFVWWKSIKEE